MIRTEISEDTIGSYFFVADGVLSADSTAYVKRPADDELFNQVLTGQYCHVLAPRQMGKSSLMVSTAQRLREQGVNTALIYLSGLGDDIGVEQWFLGLATRLKLELKLAVDLDEWWAEQSADALQRFKEFLHDIVLTELDEPVVVFIDEIETTLALDFSDEFFAAIQSAYEARSTDPTYQRLTFVLLGVATTTELVKNSNRSPFPVSHQIDLDEFGRAEVQLFQPPLQAINPDWGESIFSRVFYWTNGHPYLTQKLCMSLADSAGTRVGVTVQSVELVDWLVKKQFTLNSGRQEPNLQTIREEIENSPRRRRLLALYRQIYIGQEILGDEKSADQNKLKLIGLVRTNSGGILTVRNQIYRQAFNLDWIKSHGSLSLPWLRYLTVILILLALLLVGRFGFSLYQQRQEALASQGQDLVESFKSTADLAVRLTSLARLFDLGGYEAAGQALFYEELNAGDQLAMFELADPESRGAEIITVIKGVYKNPAVGDKQQGSALLNAMVQPLRELDYSEYSGVIDLELEITNWIKAREHFTQGDYRQAIQAYDVAINLNNGNPSLYFDRGLAYAAQGQPGQALADFTTTLNLDGNWKARVQQALIDDSQVYGTLWSNTEGYRALVGLVPSPTSTSTPTVTPIPTSTPTPTNTPTPIPPTATPTSTATPTPFPTISVPASVAASPATFTGGVPAGSFTLVSPTSPDDPSYGPTTFEWKWSGALPPQYGFEVRVWREGNLHTGVHNAVLDNQNGNIKRVGDRYRLDANIKDAAGVQGQSGAYLWAVALVQISPNFADLGLEAEPAFLRFEAGRPGDSSGGDGGGGGGGGVGID